MTAPMIREFASITSHRVEGDDLIIFLGKNLQGEEAAEILNGLREDGKLFPLLPHQKRKGAGFHRIEYVSDNVTVIQDLHEATSGLSGTLAGPHLAPVVFIRRAATVVTPTPLFPEANEHPDSDYSSGYGNYSGYIRDGPPGRRDLW